MSKTEKLQFKERAAPPKGYPKREGQYAAPGYKYPIDTEAHVRAAISYFSKPKNYQVYSPGQRTEIWGKIKAAAKKFGIEVSPESGPKVEKSMDTLFKAIMDLDVSADLDLVKGEPCGPMNDEPRAEMRSVVKSDEDADMQLSEDMSHVDFVDHPRPGSGDMNAWYEGNVSKNMSSVPMVNHPRPTSGAAKSAAGSTGGESTLEYGEAGSTSDLDGSESIDGASWELPEVVHSSSGGEPSGVPEAETVHLSEGDVDQATGLVARDMPINQTQWVGQGKEAFTGFGFPMEGAEGPGGTSGHIDFVEHPRPGPGHLTKGDVRYGVGIPGPGRQAQEAVSGREWQSGHVRYSTSEDERIAKAMEAGNGHVLGEPTLNWQMPLLKSRNCGACGQAVPSMFTKCPACGVGKSTSVPQGVYVAKSIQAKLREQPDEDVYIPGGDILIK